MSRREEWGGRKKGMSRRDEWRGRRKERTGREEWGGRRKKNEQEIMGWKEERREYSKGFR